MTSNKKKRIPFSRPYPLDSSELVDDFSKIIDTRWYTKGKNVKEFEEVMASYLDVEHAISTGTGSAALVISLYTYSNQIGADSITMPAFTFEAVRYTIEFSGITDIKYGDVDSDTWTLDDIDYSTSLVMGMDTFGNRCKIFKTEPERLFFDAAQSFGADIKRDRGALEILSFSGSKVLTTGGEGGMIVTNDGDLAKKCVHLRDLFSKMPETCALIGLAQMKHIDDIIARKAEIAKNYRRKIPLKFQEITSSNYYIVGCLMQNRDTFIRHNNEKADFREFYSKPLAKAPVTDMLAKNMLCLPNGPEILQDIDNICNMVNEWISHEA